MVHPAGQPQSQREAYVVRESAQGQLGGKSVGKIKGTKIAELFRSTSRLFGSLRSKGSLKRTVTATPSPEVSSDDTESPREADSSESPRVQRVWTSVRKPSPRAQFDKIVSHLRLEESDAEQLKSYFTQENKASAGQALAKLWKVNPDAAMSILELVSTRDITQVCEPMVAQLNDPQEAANLVEKAILNEVEKHKEPGNLLRGNSLSSKLLQAFTKNHLNNVISDQFIQHLKRFPSEKKWVPEEDKQAIVNQTQLLLNELINISGRSEDPNFKIFKRLCANVKVKVDAKFGEETGDKVVANLFMLRFANPYVISPSNMKYEGKQQSNAILATKILQKLVNKQKMEPFNDFLETNDDTMNRMVWLLTRK